MTTLLELRGIGCHFGALKALHGVDLRVEAGTRHAVVGPNGAGKSTLFSVVAGSLQPSEGDVILDGERITPLPGPRRVRLGVAQTFQRSNLFLTMTALDNVVLALSRVHGRAVRALPASRRGIDDEAHTVLEQVGLADRGRVVAGQLSHGERRALEIAVALACRPRLLLLDEPTAGASPAETALVVELLRSLSGDLTLMLVEHDYAVVARLASTVTVLQAGRILMTGTPEEVRASPAVQEAFFGTPDGEDVFLETEGPAGGAA